MRCRAQDLAEARPTFSSCRLAKSSVFSGLTARNQKFALVAPHMEKRRNALGVVDPGNALEEHLMLPRIVLPKLLHVLLLPNGNAQDLHTLWGSRKQRITSPNDSFRFQRSRSPGHLLDPTGFDATSIPHWCKWMWACVVNCSSTVVCTSSKRSGRYAVLMSSRNAITCSPGLMFSWVASRALCCPKANNSGMRGSPCSPPSPCEMYWVIPISSSHKYVDGLRRNISRRGKSDFLPSFEEGLQALRSGRSDRTPRRCQST